MDNNLSNVFSKALDDQMEKIKQDIQKQMPQKMATIRNEIYGYYRNIIESVFKNVFDEYYGEYYDEESLFASLTFINGKHIYPDVVYSKNKFKFLDRMQRLQQDMGHSVSRESTLDDYIDPDFQDSTTGLFEEQYFADDADAIYWEDIQVDPLQFWNLDLSKNNNINTLALSPIDKVYKIALRRRQQEFQRQYDSSIKSKIYKKYGIKLG